MTTINPASEAWVTREPYPGFPSVYVGNKTGLLEAQRGDLPHDDEAER